MPERLPTAAEAREAIARCLADVEDFPEPEHYSLADDVLLALENAGIPLAASPAGFAQVVASVRQGHEFRMGPFHFTCCFNEIDQRGDR